MALLNQTQQDYYDGNDFGGYQFISLDDIINNFTIAYVGEGKIIPKIKRTDIAFHAQRAIQELSFDTFKSIKSQEITLPPSNTMVLPQDYVNYTKVCWVDGNGIERPLYPTKHTSNPTPILQNSEGDYSLTAKGTFSVGANPTIVLDGEYLDIKVGMFVTGASIPGGLHPDNWDNYLVSSTSNLNGITSITIALASSGGGLISTSAETDILTFVNEDKSLILERETAYVLENAIFTAASDTITAGTATDAANIKVGMLVSHIDFPTDTVVHDVDVTSGIITVTRLDPDSLISLAGSYSISATILAGGNEVTFLSNTQNSSTWGSYSSDTSNSTGDANSYNHDTDIYDLNIGQRYGLETSMAQGNGTYYIDNLSGLIHFSSNISGKTVILKYISDGLGTDNEMVVHKFAEEAMYKCIAYAIFSTTINGQQLVPRFKKEKFAAVRQAKLRLSNIKIEELTQLMRGKSKWIKH